LFLNKNDFGSILCFCSKLCANPILRQLIFGMNSCLVLCHITHCIFVLLGENTITKHFLRHPYRSRSKTRVMGDIEEVQEKIKVDMVALKDQMTSMMEAMLSMKRLIESSAATAIATSVAVEVDTTHPSATNQAHQPTPDMAGRGGEVLGSTDNPHMGYNRNAYPYGLPCNYTPPTMHENVDHAVPITFNGQQPQPIGVTHEESRERPQGDFDSFPS